MRQCTRDSIESPEADEQGIDPRDSPVDPPDCALYHLVNEGNVASRRLAESMGGQGRVLYHAYDKSLR